MTKPEIITLLRTGNIHFAFTMIVAALTGVKILASIRQQLGPLNKI
jgi:hypothetical protein